LSEISFGNLVTDDAAGIVDGRVGIELHRLDHILLDDADLERYRRHGVGFFRTFVRFRRFLFSFFTSAGSSCNKVKTAKVNQLKTI
jgi:hypothetical protein